MTKTILFTVLSLIFSNSLSAQTPAATPALSIDEKIDAAVAPTAQFISDIIFYEVTIAGTSIPLILIWLLAGAVFFTVYLGFINIRGFKHALDIVRGGYDQPEATGEV